MKDRTEMISHAFKRFFPLAVSLLLLLIISEAGESAEPLSILPGKGAAGYRIGGPYPKKIRTGIKLFPVSGTRIERIEIETSVYYLEGSWLRVGKSTKKDVIRFYGEPTETTGSGELRYPYRGISFQIDTGTSTLTKIIIYSPRVRTFQFKQYQIKQKALDLYRQLYKQKK